jgi:hypothetical protein
MNRILAFSRPVGLILSALALSGCLMIKDVRRVDDPRPYFDRAYDEIQRLENGDPHRRGRAEELGLLVHGGRGPGLCGPHSQANVGGLARGSISAAQACPLTWMVLSDLEEAGRGLLCDVKDEDDRILIWLR